MSYFFSEFKPAWLGNATVMCYYLPTCLCHVMYKYVMPNQNLIPYSYFITDWYKKTHTMKYSLILLAVIGTTFAEVIFEERFGSGTYFLILMFCTKKKRFGIFGFNKYVTSHFTLH